MQKLVFDLVEELPKPETNTIGINTSLKTTHACTQKCACSHRSQPCQTKTIDMCEKDQYATTYQSQRGIHQDRPGSYENLQSQDENGMIVTHNMPGKSRRTYTETMYSTTGQGNARVDVYYFDHGNSA